MPATADPVELKAEIQELHDKGIAGVALTGYQVWADALKPIFFELLGPPAKEDHAPPATGDPSKNTK